MIKCELNNGVGNVEFEGEYTDVMSDLMVAVFHTMKEFANNEEEFEASKKILILALIRTKYDDVREDNENEGLITRSSDVVDYAAKYLERDTK